MIVDELVARIGLEFQGAEKAVQALGKVRDFKKEIAAVGGVIFALEGALKAVAISVADTVDQYADFGAAVGASVESIETLTAAAEMNGGGFEDVQRALKTLTDQAGAAAKGNETSAESFARLGVNIYQANGHIKTADQLIDSVADGLSKMKDPASQVNAAIDVLGKGAIKLLPALTNGRAGLSNFRAEMEKIGVVMSENTNRRFQRLGDSLDMLKLRATGAKNILAQAFLPFAESTVNSLNTFLEQNASKLFDFGQRFASLVTAPFALFLDIVKALPSEISALLAVGAALTAVFTIPAIAVLALAFLVAAIAEDIKAFLDGQESQIGDVVKEWQNFLNVFRDLDKEAEGFAAVLTRIARILADVGGMIFGDKKGRRKAFNDFTEATGIDALGNLLARDSDVDALANQEPISSDVYSGIATTRGVPLSLLANPPRGPARQMQRYENVASGGAGSMVHAPQITINGSNMSPEEASKAAEDAIIRSALELESMSGARK